MDGEHEMQGNTAIIFSRRDWQVTTEMKRMRHSDDNKMKKWLRLGGEGRVMTDSTTDGRAQQSKRDDGDGQQGGLKKKMNKEK